MSLNVENYTIEKKLSESENEYFRRVTIQLDPTNDIEKLLNSQIPTFSKHDIKFKRSKQLIDRTSFVLKSVLNNKQDKIAENRIKLYLSLLIGNNIQFTLTDFSTTDEQICLIQCNNEIEFKKVYKQYQTKSQLQGRDLSIVQVYEFDTIIIRFPDEKIMSYDDVENIIRSARIDVFTYQLTEDNCVEVEFINVDAFKRWMLNVEKIIVKFRVTITPIITYVDDTHENENATISTAQSIPFNIPTSAVSKSQSTTIKIRPDWVMVAAHSVFQVELKDYIRDELGGEITIHGNEISYTGSFPRLPRCPSNEAILKNKINNYMQKLRYQVLRDLKPYQARILRKHSTTVAFRRDGHNDYSVAAKYNDFVELKSQLFPKHRPHHQLDQTTTVNQQMDINSKPVSPVCKQESIEQRPSHSTASTVNNVSLYPITSAEELSMFSLSTFENRLEQHLRDTYNVKIIIERTVMNTKSKEGKLRITIKIIGQNRDAENALEYVQNLFSLLRTRKFDEKNDGNWTKIEDATVLIQYHFDLEKLTCTCQKMSSTTVNINYFDITNPQFGIDEQRIEDLINNRFSLATITYTSQSSTSKFTKDWKSLEDAIRKRDDYKKDICLYDETKAMYLFGLTKIVKEFRQIFEELKNRYVPQSYKMILSEKQFNYLVHVAQNDLSKLEKRYKADGCDVSLARLRQSGDFLAPIDMHAEIKANLDALTQIDEVTFEIQSSAFGVLINQEPKRLTSLIKTKCYFEIKSRTHRIDIPIPKAQGTDLEDLAKQSRHTNASVTNTNSINIGNSTITICTGDLTTQTVDVIVVCSTSEIMRKTIVTKAGVQVQTEFTNTTSSNGDPVVATCNGALPCKKILFIPWQSGQSNPHILKPSLSTFVSSAINYVIKNQYKTLAFPSVGCGKLGFDPSIIAKHMIDEALTQLGSNNNQLNVSFVLLPDQNNVYDEFVKYLQCIKPSRTTVSKASSTTLAAAAAALTTSKSIIHSKLSYDETVTEITLISATNDHLVKCKQDILKLAHSSSFTKQITNKNDLLDWSQNTINQFYTYCLKQHVKPTLDLNSLSVELVGPKDAVHEAEKQFFELTTETYKQARNHAVSRGVIWSVEVTPNSDNWQQYSFKLNGMIEDAFLKKQSQLDFVNDKQERCRIIFSSMEEHHGSDVRAIRRKVVDSLLPDTWEPSDQNCKRVTLQSSSKEYQDVLKQFNSTMNGQHLKIIKIERIQNERWYKQYTAHRDEYKRRYGNLDERLLFHGCTGISANQIIQECFNRSFAGVNGVAYGCGVYFSSNASYSHSYAKPSVSGERTMFLARVLIGRTHQGNQSMKVPPAGYDTTTDGHHIFVVYHDAGVYADHLITYQ
ncbi:hypothetical protein I4U23_019422 [Adineta vaga]|nr:hypothetical protein I4U23_019422 [Adineta vaga]